MDMFTMNDAFIAQEVVDEFISAIWTERYSTCGDVQLVVPATPSTIEMLQEGTFLGLRGSKEVMQIKTQNIEKNLMTVKGKTLVEFLDQRLLWEKNPDTSDVTNLITDYVVTDKVGQAIADVVSDMVIATTPFGGAYVDVNLEWDLEEIAGLVLGAVDTSGDDERLTFTTGPLYQAISQIAQQFDVGISLYLDSANIDTGFVLKFTTYRGVDRTSDGPGPLVRLQPALDSLSDIKELNSIEFYKNTAYVYYDGEISVHYEDPLDIPEGFDRRVLVTEATGEPVGRKVTYDSAWLFTGTWRSGTYSTVLVGPTEVAAFREQHAKDALANNNYIRAIDGQTSPENEFKFGVDYGLGDLIELEGLTGNIAKARVTEYIRSQDKSGEREYPTISVV